MPKPMHWQQWPEDLQGRLRRACTHSCTFLRQSRKKIATTRHIVHYHFTVGYRPICLHCLPAIFCPLLAQAGLSAVSVYVPVQERSPCRRSHRRKAVRRGIEQLKTDIIFLHKTSTFFRPPDGWVQDSKFGGIFSLHPCFWK